MPLEICGSTIVKLAHEITEIRVRTLKHIEGKLYKALNYGDDINFNVGSLIKHLIRWFGQKPLLEELTVLKLIQDLLKNKYMYEISKCIGVRRLKKELEKVNKIVTLDDSRTLINEIQILLDNFLANELENETNSEIDIISLYSITDLLEEVRYSEEDYEEAWSKAAITDLSSMKLLHDSLANTSAEEDLEHSLNYLKTAIYDYPAEYFLQPPYIIDALFKLSEFENLPKELLFDALITLTSSIKGRLHIRSLSKSYSSGEYKIKIKPRNQLTLAHYSTQLLNLCSRYLKKCLETFQENHGASIFKLLESVMSLISMIDMPRKNLNTHLIDFGYMAKNYRESLQFPTKFFRNLRIKYILILNVVAKLAKLYIAKNIDENAQENILKSGMKKMYNPETYTSTSSIISSPSIADDNIWLNELENATLDFAIKEFYQRNYILIADVVSQINGKSNDKFDEILNCDSVLLPAILVLRQPENFSDADLILHGLATIETLEIHKSEMFIEKMIKAIVTCEPLYEGNSKLKIAAEVSVLRFLSVNDISLKRFVYKQLADSIKSLFGSLMDGQLSKSRNYNNEFVKSQTLGVPLTSEILTEIICFGSQHSDPLIRSNSEIMICLLLKSKLIIGKYWQNMLELLLPILPLLQCLAPISPSMDQLVLDLLNPDNELPTLDIILGNIRFLFSKDQYVRNEALSRLIYILIAIDESDSDHLLPNMAQISDTISCDICLLTAPKDPLKMFSTGMYEKSMVYTLLELIKCENVEPEVRKTTFLQLNIVCQDAEFNKIVHDEDGWYFILQALENSLKKNSTTDYIDTAKSSVGILVKLLLCNPEFRREISKVEHIYLILLRALFLFPYDTTMQQDCSLALFLLSYSSYVVGYKDVTVPKICSKLHLPLKCTFHWCTSPHIQKNKLEEMYLELERQESQSDDNLRRRDDHNQNILKMQYLRLSFAKLWFDGVCHFLNSINAHGRTADLVLDYTTLPGHLYTRKTKGVVELSETFEFNKKLCVLKEDLELINCSSASNNYSFFLKVISNATNHTNAQLGIEGLHLNLLLETDDHLRINGLISLFKKFLTIPPATKSDLLVFNNTLQICKELLQKNNKETFSWLTRDVHSRHSILMSYLKNTDFPIVIYQNVCHLLKSLFQQYSQNEFDLNEFTKLINEGGVKSSSVSNIYNKMFEIVFPLICENFRERNIERGRLLLSLLQSITCTSRVDIDMAFSQEVVNKMLQIIKKLKSFTQAGSQVNKNCLFVTVNIINESISEINVSSDNVRLLSGLCGHQDIDIRAISWCILGKLAENLSGAKILVKELSFLPGGFHACCITTLMDRTEAPIIRVAAGQTLSNLLRFSGKDSELDMSVAPFCADMDPSTTATAYDLLIDVFKRHAFFKMIEQSLDYFYISDFISKEIEIDGFITCDIVQTFCSILGNFIDLKPNVMNELNNERFIISIFDLIKVVPTCVSDSSIRMVGGICKLMARFFQQNSDEFLEKFIFHNIEIVVVLIHILEMFSDEKYTSESFVSICYVLKILANETRAFERICQAFLVIKFEKIIWLLVYGLSKTNNAGFQFACMELIITMLLKSQNETFEFESFSNILDTIPIDASANDSFDKTFLRKLFSDYEKCSFYGSEIIFYELNVLFRNIFLKSNKKNLTRKKLLICESIAALLKCSQKARFIADTSDFLNVLISILNNIYTSIGTSSIDFIKKYGETKKDKIVEELTVYFGIIWSWYSESCLVKEVQILELSKVILTFWQWTSHSVKFRTNILNCLVCLSEDSILVCKQFSSIIPGFSQSILQLIEHFVKSETDKIKNGCNDQTSLRMGLRILSNLSSCIEGRLQIVKLNTLQTINSFHPSAIKMHKNLNSVIIVWLEFWEIFSRYPEGGTVRDLYLLCVLISKSQAIIRNLCLTILRNMAFLNTNKAALLSSDDFLYIIDLILDGGNCDEQVLMCTTIWKLIAGNYKGKHVMKNRSILKKLGAIQSKFSTDMENDNSISSIENNTLYNIIDILLKILN